MNWAVKRYVTARGEKIVDDFVKYQDKSTQSKILRAIRLVTIYGPDLGLPHTRHLGDKLYELRIRGKNEVRIFFVAIVDQKTVVLLHAFKKRTQKLPKKELALARARQKTLT